jgi:hypothetical protein
MFGGLRQFRAFFSQLWKPVIEASLAYQSVELVEWTLRIHLVGNEWVKEWTLLRTTWHKRDPWWFWTDTPVKPQWVHCKLD